MVRASITLLLLAGLAACEKKNNQYCDGEDGQADEANCPPDGPTGCTMDNECGGQICDTAAGECVQCTATRPEACTDTTPVCSTSRTCTACTSHAQCTESDVCLPDGACGDVTQVAYVSASGTGMACTKAAPCPLLATAVSKNLPFIKFAADGAANATTKVVIDGKAVVILAEPGAKLDRDGDGPVLEITSASADVSIYDLQITGASGLSGADGILVTPNGGTPKLTLTRAKVDMNQGCGISSSGGTLTVSQSTISGNTGGGISVMTGTFAIVGNVFFNNGNDTTLIGGVNIGTAQNVANRLEFNSFARNKAQDTIGCAIHCLAGTFTARNNVMAGNATASNMAQVGGTCTHTYSIARPGTVPSGTGNSGADPLFVDTVTGNLHIMLTSPARGMADPSSDLTGIAARDLDGDARTNPADMGADEAP